MTHLDQLDRYITEQMKVQAIPGLSLAVVHKGHLVIARGYGMASVELRALATPETVYQLQSITKAFVALGIMMLIDDARLTLDTTVVDFFPLFPFTWSAITIRHLLAMTSGIANMFRDHATDEDALAFAQHTTSDAAIIAWATSRPLHFVPGTYYHYSPTNYHLLGMMIEQVAGQPWYAFLEERIFKPLQMSKTQVVDLDSIILNRAAGYRSVDGQLQNGYYLTPTLVASASGGLSSTVRDLARWDAALYTEHFVSRAVLEELWTPNDVDSFFSEPALAAGSTYGLGWDVAQHSTGRVVGHSGGNWTGFSTRISRFVDQQQTVIVLTNLMTADAEQISKDVAALYLPASSP